MIIYSEHNNNIVEVNVSDAGFHVLLVSYIDGMMDCFSISGSGTYKTIGGIKRFINRQNSFKGNKKEWFISDTTKEKEQLLKDKYKMAQKGA